MIGTCSRCQTTDPIILPPLNTTDYTYTLVAAPSCTATGVERYTWKTTTYGSFFFQLTLPKTAHNYVETVTPPACTTQGYTIHTCAACGASYTDSYLEALGHDWDDGIVTQQPTETEPGTRLFTCMRCGVTKTETIPELNAMFNPFSDVKPGKYYYIPVLWAFWRGITSGMDETHFGPGLTCTRGQIVTFLWNAMGQPAPTITDCPFVDVKEGKFYYQAMLWALEMGITSGKDETHFAPNESCTRGQIVTFLWNAMGRPEPTITSSPFEDVKEGKYYYDAMLWALESGVTSGIDETHFGPNQTCTRGQAVTFHYKTLS